jgi:hypothetical protein
MDRLTLLAALALARVLRAKAKFGTASCACDKGELVITWREKKTLELSVTQQRVFDVLKVAPRTVRVIMREADYAQASESTVRQALADLVRLTLARHTPDGYSRAGE